MWINISLHTRVRHLRRGKSKRRRDGTLAKFFFLKKEKLRCIESHPQFISHAQSPDSLILSRLSLGSITIEGQRANICRAMLCQWSCASGSADSRSVCGGIGERRTLTVGTVTKCSSQIIPMDQSTARFLRDTQKKSSVTTVPGHAYAYHWCEQALIDNCLKSLTKWEQWRENNMSVEQGHTQDWQQTRVISPWIKVSEKENKKGRNASSALLFPSIICCSLKATKVLF